MYNVVVRVIYIQGWHYEKQQNYEQSSEFAVTTARKGILAISTSHWKTLYTFIFQRHCHIIVINYDCRVYYEIRVVRDCA